MPISDEQRDLYTGNLQDAVIIDTLEIKHSLLPEVIRFCNNNNTIKCIIEDGTEQIFYPSNFAIKMPSFENKGALNYNFTFDNVNFKYIKQLNEIINKTDEPLKLYYRLYTTKNYSYPLMEAPYDINIFDITLSNKSIAMSGQQLASLNKSIPQKKYVTSIFSGIKDL